MLICLLLCAAAVSSTVLSDQVGAQNGHPPGRKVHELVRRNAPSSYLASTQDFPTPLIRNIRNGRDFDTLLGRSFGTSKRRDSRTAPDVSLLPKGKKNFDEIDNAGFSDYLRKRISDYVNPKWYQWTPAGKRNFDEIDNAGFRDYLYKRQSVDVDPPWDVRHTAGKRNFDEIDNAGFKDYLYKRQLLEFDPPWNMMNTEGKRNFDEIDNAGFKDYLYKRRPKGSRGMQGDENDGSEGVLVQ